MHIMQEPNVFLVVLFYVSQEHDRQYMHIGTMVEFAFALMGKLDLINKHSFNDFKLRVGELCREAEIKYKVYNRKMYIIFYIYRTTM